VVEFAFHHKDLALLQTFGLLDYEIH